MEKTETIHVRVSPKTKEDSEKILKQLGINMSYAVSLFLNQVIIQKKIPFDISLIEEQPTESEKLSFALNQTGGKDIDTESKRILHLYASKQIDYETACFALTRRHTK